MILKNVLVYQDGEFIKKDLHIKEKLFVLNSSGPVLDLHGMYLMPGFVDSHAHVLGVGHKYGYLNLEQIDSQEKLLNLIKNCNDRIIKGRGWSEQVLGGYPDKNLIDQINKPVVLKRKCGHIAILNKTAMDIVGIYKPDGVLRENELDILEDKLKDENPEKFFDIGEHQFLKHGVTFVHSDDLHGVSWDQLKEILMSAKIRIFEKLYFANINDLIEFDEFGDLTDKVYVKGVKIFADGSLGGKTAYLSVPYPDEEQYRGVKLLDSIQIEDFAKICSQKKVQLSVHAIGDAAVHEVAKVYQRYPGNRIIHTQLVNKNDLPFLRESYFSIQPHFAFEDQELIEKRIPKELDVLKYDFLNLFKQGYKISFSTDAPVSPEDPKYVIEKALKMGFSLKEAIELYTIAGAKIAGFDNIGKVKEGYIADFAIYERDPLKLEDDPVAVYVSGELVYEK